MQGCKEQRPRYFCATKSWAQRAVSFYQTKKNRLLMLFSGLFLGIQFQKQLEVWLYMRGAWGWNSTATEPSVLPSQNQLLPLGVESSIRTKKSTSKIFQSKSPLEMSGSKSHLRNLDALCWTMAVLCPVKLWACNFWPRPCLSNNVPLRCVENYGNAGTELKPRTSAIHVRSLLQVGL